MERPLFFSKRLVSTILQNSMGTIYEFKKEITVENTIEFVKKYSIEEVSEKYLLINKS